MGLSRLAAKCKMCPYVSTCDHKQMEALGYLPMPEPTVEIQADVAVSFEDILDQLSRAIQVPKQYLRGDDV